MVGYKNKNVYPLISFLDLFDFDEIGSRNKDVSVFSSFYILWLLDTDLSYLDLFHSDEMGSKIKNVTVRSNLCILWATTTDLFIA